MFAALLHTAAGKLLQRLYTRAVQWIWRADLYQIFDEDYYLRENPDVRASGMDPLFHFLWTGAAELRDPHPLFHVRYYLARYEDVARARSNPLVHYLRYGAGEARQPHPNFDPVYYRAANPDVEAEGWNPLVHFLRRGHKENRLPYAAFDYDFYLATYPGAARDDVLARFIADGGIANARPAAAPDSYLPAAKQPPRTGTLPAQVDVIVPVYKGFRQTRECIDSVLHSTPRTPFRIVVVNDATPDPELAAHLRRLAHDRAILLIENRANAGFVQSANAAMRAGENDVVLLNSDTLVYGDWLDRLAACAYSGERVGTVTPFSNNATVCSYPQPGVENELPPHCDGAALDRDFAAVNAGRSSPLPTAVGFCMYVRRECIRETGFFDAETFGAGYGEENDFCMRAAAAGWRHLLACDVFVYHEGGVSFGAAAERRTAAMRALLGKHPLYADLVRRHMQADPAAPYRIAVTAHRIRHSGKRIAAAVTHALGGGVERHLRDLQSVTAKDAIWLVLRPTPAGGSVLECKAAGYEFSAAFGETQYAHVLAVLQACGVERLHIHHLLGHALDVRKLAVDLAVPFDFTVHDYYAMCRKATFTDEHGRYCGEPPACTGCVSGDPSSKTAADDAAWRAAHSWLIADAERTIAPSLDAAARVSRYYPGARIVAAAHPGPVAVTPAAPEPLSPGARLRIAVLGVMAPHKGLPLLAETSALAKRRRLPFDFTLIGGIESRDRRPYAFASTGPYEDADLPALLTAAAPHLVWFPAQWPETFSYTLDACLAAGLPVAAPDLGAFPERLSGRPWSWVLSWKTSGEEWLRWFSGVRERHYCTGIGPIPPEPKPAATRDFYPEAFLRWSQGHRESEDN